MDTAAFCRDILQPKLYDSTTTSADEYAELFDGEVYVECWTSMRHYVHVVAAAVSMTFDSSPSKPDRPRGIVEDWNAGIVVQAVTMIGAPTGQPVWRHATTSKSRHPITSGSNLTQRPAT